MNRDDRLEYEVPLPAQAVAAVAGPLGAERVYHTRGWLWGELLVLFAVVPLVMAVGVVPAHPLMVAAVFCGGCVLTLLRDPTFDGRLLWNRRALGPRLLAVLPLWAFAVAVLLAGMWAFHPDKLFSLPLRHTGIWAALMLAYPIISVYPQEVIYRAFFFHRYRRLVRPGWPMILLSAAAFAWMHVIFRNYVAVTLCAAGGVIFAWRYWRTGSLLVTSVEHMIYGQLVFTIGLGEFIMTAGGTLSVVAAR